MNKKICFYLMIPKKIINYSGPGIDSKKVDTKTNYKNIDEIKKRVFENNKEIYSFRWFQFKRTNIFISFIKENNYFFSILYQSD